MAGGHRGALAGECLKRNMKNVEGRCVNIDFLIIRNLDEIDYYEDERIP